MHHGNLIHPLVEEVLANALTMVNQSAADELNNENDTEERGSFNDLQQARCHWIQLDKLDLQLKVIQSTIAYVIENFESMRLLWSFGKNYEKEKLYNDQRFHDYCTCFQTALKMIMEFVDEPRDMCKLIRNIGARHFFYNVYEPHTEEMLKLLIR
uniref:Globin family profile domain-containing protein n=1 Tax=Brugia malayi TaxID=6279 RepID=A0A5S6PFM3_BRUMA